MTANLLGDYTFWVYFVINISVLYTAILLSVDWYRLPARPDPIYIYVWLLMWGVWINMDYLIYARALHHIDKAGRNSLVDCIWWTIRVLPMAVATISIAVHLTYRKITGNKGSYPFIIEIGWVKKTLRYFKLS